MKTTTLFYFLLLIAIPRMAMSQSTSSAISEIKILEEQERTAVNNADTASLFRLWSPDYVVNNSNNMILTAAQVKKFVRGTGMDKTSFTRNIEKISFIKDVAVVMGSETVTPKDKNGMAGKTVYRRYTNVWIKMEDGWKLSARQATNTLIQ